MYKIIFQILIIVGSILIGLGIGIIIGWQAEWQSYLYWLVLCASLILGGFFLAWGMARRRQKIKNISYRNKEDENEDIRK